MDFHIIQILGTNYKLYLMHLVVFYVVEYLKKCIILIYKWFQYNLSLCALGSGLHAPCDLSYDIEIYLSIYLSVTLSKEKG